MWPTREAAIPSASRGSAGIPTAPSRKWPHTQTVDPEYFHAMQIPLLQGRYFTTGDSSNTPAVTVVNETLARGFFPKGAIGHQILLGAPQPTSTWLTIVGVVGDVKTAALSHSTMPQFYTPVAQDPSTAMSLVIRTALDPSTVARSAQQVVRAIDPSLPVYDVITMDDRIAKSIRPARGFETTLLAVFAASALFLAAIGIFGVVAHLDGAARTREIGITHGTGRGRRTRGSDRHVRRPPSCNRRYNSRSGSGIFPEPHPEERTLPGSHHRPAVIPAGRRLTHAGGFSRLPGSRAAGYEGRPGDRPEGAIMTLGSGFAGLFLRLIAPEGWHYKAISSRLSRRLPWVRSRNFYCVPTPCHPLHDCRGSIAVFCFLSVRYESRRESSVESSNT